MLVRARGFVASVSVIIAGQGSCRAVFFRPTPNGRMIDRSPTSPDWSPTVKSVERIEAGLRFRPFFTSFAVFSAVGVTQLALKKLQLVL